MEAEMTTLLGDCFSSSREKGFEGLPLLSVTLNDGLVARESLERKSDTNLAADEHLLVREGYIAYNMMRAWQGALGRADRDGLVSPAYVALKPKRNINSRYAEYLFKTPRLIYLFWAYSYGLTEDRLRLYFKDFARIPARIVSLSEQKKIAEILSTWDEAIAANEVLLANSRHRKKALMQKLLTGRARLPGFLGEWSTTTLSDIGHSFTGLSGKTKEDFGQGLPYIPYKNVFLNRKVDPEFLDYVVVKEGERQSLVRAGDILFTTSSETPEEVGMSSVLLHDLGIVYLNSFCFGFRPTNKDVLDSVFASFYLRSAGMRKLISMLAQGATRYNISAGRLMKLKLEIPSIQEQRAIADILTVADCEIEALEHRINNLKTQKKALMQQLLTGKKRVQVDEVTQ